MLIMKKIDKKEYTQKEIELACENLRDALLETIELDEQMFNLIQLQKKARFSEILHFIKIT